MVLICTCLFIFIFLNQSWWHSYFKIANMYHFFIFCVLSSKKKHLDILKSYSLIFIFVYPTKTYWPTIQHFYSCIFSCFIQMTISCQNRLFIMSVVSRFKHINLFMFKLIFSIDYNCINWDESLTIFLIQLWRLANNVFHF